MCVGREERAPSLALRVCVCLGLSVCYHTNNGHENIKNNIDFHLAVGRRRQHHKKKSNAPAAHKSTTKLLIRTAPVLKKNRARMKGQGQSISTNLWPQFQHGVHFVILNIEIMMAGIYDEFISALD